LIPPVRTWGWSRDKKDSKQFTILKQLPKSLKARRVHDLRIVLVLPQAAADIAILRMGAILPVHA
jgi:hypothetical protein